jgi:hypothetical protein
MLKDMTGSLQYAYRCEYSTYIYNESKSCFPVTFLFWPDDDRLGGRNMLPIFYF